MATKTRSELKLYFVKNAIPTEGNFADLIDSQLNQSDDGVFKPAGEPLSVVAASGGQSRALRLYSAYPAANPDWLISLNPAQDPADATKNRPGFGIADGTGRTRLFIDPGTGNLGVGTNTPADRMSIQDGDVRIEGGRYRRLKIISDKYWAGIELVTREQGEAGNPHIDFTHGDLDAPNYGIRVAAPTNDTLYIEAGSGTANLQVRGNAVITGATQTRGIAVNNAQNTGVGAGVWLWNVGDSNHVIYSANPKGKSPADQTPAQGFFDANHRMRFRTAASQGFLFENNKEEALVDIDATNGRMWTKGAVYAGNSDIYFTRTDHNHSGIGNTTGWAAIENSANYNALMILGRATDTGRMVALWDALTVNGSLTVTGGGKINQIGIGTQEHGATTWPYETIQMNPSHNLRIWYGTTERFILANSGGFTMKFDKGYWVFQTDGNLVKYRNDGTPLWALNKVSGVTGW